MIETKPIARRVPLRQRVLNASVWSFAGYGVSLTIRFGSNLVMTRLLVPEMFAIMAIATVIMVGLTMFADLGLRLNIVQSPRGDDPLFLNTAWVVQIIRGMVLWVLALGIAALVVVANVAGGVPATSVYADPVLPYVIAVFAFSAVVAGFETTKGAEADRNIVLGRVVQLQISAQVVGLVFMLAWAAIDRSIWALIAGAMSAQLVSVALGHMLLPGTPNRWQWDWPAAREIIHFGKWVFASSILGFLVSSSDRLILGGLVDVGTLGLYVIALLIFGAVEQLVTKINVPVVLPALSEVARNGHDLKAAYYRFHTVIAAIAYFCAGALMMSGQALIWLLYDARYAHAGWMLEVLAVALLATPFQLAVQCYLALNMPQLHSRILIVRLIGLCAGTLIGFQLFGLPGALWGVIGSQLSSVPMFIFYNVKNGVFDWRREMVLLPVIPAGLGVGWLVALGVGR